MRRLKKGRLWTNRPEQIRPAKRFSKTAFGVRHGLEVVRVRGEGLPDQVRCPCGRAEDEDMMVAYGGEWRCSGCWTERRRQGTLEEAAIDVAPRL